MKKGEQEMYFLFSSFLWEWPFKKSMLQLPFFNSLQFIGIVKWKIQISRDAIDLLSYVISETVLHLLQPVSSLQLLLTSYLVLRRELIFKKKNFKMLI